MRPTLDQIKKIAHIICEAPEYYGDGEPACSVIEEPEKLVFKFQVTRNRMTSKTIHHAQLPIIPVTLGVPGYESDVDRDTHRSDRVDAQEFYVSLTVEQTLEVIFDKLLQREFETLLTSAQNNDYFIQTGTKHPITGAGSTESAILTKRERLFVLNEDRSTSPYKIATTGTDGSRIEVTVNPPANPNNIRAYFKESLNLTDAQIIVVENKITINLPVDAILEKIKERRSNYQGVIVLNEAGDVALAYRHHSGYAGAGGHCSDPYHPKLGSVGIELHEEFGVELKDPRRLEVGCDCIYRENGLAILLVKPEAWKLTTEAATYAKKTKRPFHAEVAEFHPETERFVSVPAIRSEQLPLRNLPSLDLYLAYEQRRIQERVRTMDGLQNISVEINDRYTTSESFRIPDKDCFGQISFVGPADQIDRLRGLLPSTLKVTQTTSSDGQIKISINNSNPHLLFPDRAVQRETARAASAVGGAQMTPIVAVGVRHRELPTTSAIVRADDSGIVQRFFQSYSGRFGSYWTKDKQRDATLEDIVAHANHGHVATNVGWRSEEKAYSGDGTGQALIALGAERNDHGKFTVDDVRTKIAAKIASEENAFSPVKPR